MSRPATIDTRATRAAFVGLLTAVLLAAVAISRLAPPASVAADAPDGEFSAARAMADVERIAAAAHPMGSAEHRRVREYLLAELTELGLEPRTQEAVVVEEGSGGRIYGARVVNVLARLPGKATSGTLLLVSHYDSRAGAPGAGDAGAGVAAILGALRALCAGPALDNDLIVLLTDGEELGLLGAKAFVDEHPWAAEVSLVLNFEARGNAGLAAMFETGPGNYKLVRELGRAAPFVFANSLSYEVYRRMPNDTDFSVFKRAGVPGLNFAFIDGHPAYHHALDTAAALSRGSLQHHGSYVLSLARHFGDLDLSSLEGPDGIYFNPFGWSFVAYPATWAVPLAIVAGLLVVLVLVLGRRRRTLTPTAILNGMGLFAGSVVVSALAAALVRSQLRVFPALTRTPHSLPYDSGLLALALVVLAAAVAAALARFTALPTLGLAAGVWSAWALLGIVLSSLLPGGSYLFVWPALAGLGGTLLALLSSDGENVDVRGMAALSLGALPAVFLFAPLVRFLYVGLTLRQAGAATAIAALGLTALLPHLGVLVRTRLGRWLPAGCAMAAVALVALVVARDDASEQRPRTDSLLYVLDAEAGSAQWLSLDDEPDDWTTGFLGGEPERGEVPWLRLGKVLQAEAPVVALAAPTTERLSDSGGKARRVEVRFASARGASVLRLQARAQVPITAVTIAGRRIAEPRLTGGEGGEPSVYVAFFGLPAEGIRVEFELAGRWPVEVDVVDQSWGLPDAAALGPLERPAGLIRSSSWRTDTTSVRTSALF